jgi:hypothetical protein
MTKCPINNCKNNHGFECKLKDLTLNTDMRCVCFEFKNRKCKQCGVEFKLRNEKALYCSVKCRNLFNVNAFRRKEQKKTLKAEFEATLIKPDTVIVGEQELKTADQLTKPFKKPKQEFKTFFKVK